MQVGERGGGGARGRHNSVSLTYLGGLRTAHDIRSARAHFCFITLFRPINANISRRPFGPLAFPVAGVRLRCAARTISFVVGCRTKVPHPCPSIAVAAGLLADSVFNSVARAGIGGPAFALHVGDSLEDALSMAPTDNRRGTF